ncbi:MAG TPA: hypothetical protein VMX94_05350, partial [Armatimonadota bacterium]|nr:hypothetical protein [Armatimonadota bacterium]
AQDPTDELLCKQGQLRSGHLRRIRFVQQALGAETNSPFYTKGLTLPAVWKSASVNFSAVSQNSPQIFVDKRAGAC